MIEKISQKAYAKRIGVSQPSVSYRLNRGISLPGVRKIERFSRFYVLHFDNETDIAEAKKTFRESLIISK